MCILLRCSAPLPCATHAEWLLNLDHATGAGVQTLTCSAVLVVAVRAGGVQLASVAKPTIVGSDDHGKQERNHRAGCGRPIVNRLEPIVLRPEPSLQERFGEEGGVAGVGRTEFGIQEQSWLQQLHMDVMAIL